MEEKNPQEKEKKENETAPHVYPEHPAKLLRGTGCWNSISHRLLDPPTWIPGPAHAPQIPKLSPPCSPVVTGNSPMVPDSSTVLFFHLQQHSRHTLPIVQLLPLISASQKGQEVF